MNSEDDRTSTANDGKFYSFVEEICEDLYEVLDAVVADRLGGSHQVWVKTTGFPSWPAEILNVSEARAICTIAPALAKLWQEDHLLVRYFGGTGQQYAWFDASSGLRDLKVYDEGSKMDNMPSKRGKHRMLVLKAMDLADERLAEVRKAAAAAKNKAISTTTGTAAPDATSSTSGRSKRTAARPQRFREYEHELGADRSKKEKKATAPKVEWTVEEDRRLEKLLSNIDEGTAGRDIDWTAVAKRLNSNRTAKAVHSRWFAHIRLKRKKRKPASASSADASKKISPPSRRRQMPIGLSLSVEEQRKWAQDRKTTDTMKNLKAPQNVKAGRSHARKMPGGLAAAAEASARAAAARKAAAAAFKIHDAAVAKSLQTKQKASKSSNSKVASTKKRPRAKPMAAKKAARTQQEHPIPDSHIADILNGRLMNDALTGRQVYTEMEFRFSEHGPLTMELDAQMCVCKISAGGMAAKAGIKIGMKLVRFQGIRLAGFTFEKCMNMIRSTPRPWTLAFKVATRKPSAGAIKNSSGGGSSSSSSSNNSSGNRAVGGRTGTKKISGKEKTTGKSSGGAAAKKRKRRVGGPAARSEELAKKKARVNAPKPASPNASRVAQFPKTPDMVRTRRLYRFPVSSAGHRKTSIILFSFAQRWTQENSIIEGTSSSVRIDSRIVAVLF
eukprot:SAG31_NODE_1458_length_8257_cov_10.274209_2_plen_670_part_00